MCAITENEINNQKRPEERRSKKARFVLGLINIFFAMLMVILVLNKMGVLTRADIEGAPKYSYLSNAQYEANVTMFLLNHRETDVVFAGDSITAYGRFHEFFPDADLLNRGIGSDTAEGLYNRIDEIVSHHPQKIFIMIGINDIACNIPKEESIGYYEKTISEIKNSLPDCSIFIESVLPSMNVRLNAIEDYNNSLREVCAQSGVEFIDLYPSFLCENGVNPELFSADGVHLNGNGYKIWIDTIQEKVSDE